jgi:hypothetical protein
MLRQRETRDLAARRQLWAKEMPIASYTPSMPNTTHIYIYSTRDYRILDKTKSTNLRRPLYSKMIHGGEKGDNIKL